MNDLQALFDEIISQRVTMDVVLRRVTFITLIRPALKAQGIWVTYICELVMKPMRLR